jgi:hypothetical protein
VAALTTSGCGFNDDGEPSIHVSRANNVLVASERGLGGGSDAWVRYDLLRTAKGAVGGSGATACDLYYGGQPNGAAGAGASGGDVDTAFGSAALPTGNYPAYLASLNLGSVSVSRSLDNGATWQTTPVVAGLPADDREWIAAFGATASLLTFHDIATNQIDVTRSDDAGTTYAEISQAIPVTGPYSYAAMNNELGNIVIDHVNLPPQPAGLPIAFRAYQSFVAPSSPPNITKHPECADPALFVCGSLNEAFVSVSNDGGFTWTVKPIPCSVSGAGLDHQFPNVSVAPNGNLWETWSDDANVFAAVSTNQGNTWTCGKVSNGGRNVMPWIVAATGGEDLVYYGAAGSNGPWYVYFAQNLSLTNPGNWSRTPVLPVHSGPVCEQGFTCSGDRQLLDDFGVDVDFQSGWAHIAYSHDCTQPLGSLCTSGPSQLGGPSTYTGYAVQTGGPAIGNPN